MFYEIVTRFWHPHLTKINKTDMESREVYTVAEIEREPGKEPRIRFGGDKGHWMSAAEFVKYDPEHAYVCSVVVTCFSFLTEAVLFCRGGTFVESDVTYRWKTHKGHLQVSLPL